MTNYATKTDLNNVAHVDTSGSALKSNLSSLKTEVDILKLSTVPTDLSKLTNKVANDLVEKIKFSALEKKVTESKTEQDNFSNTATNNKSTTTNLKTKVDDNDLTKYVKKVTVTLKLVI